MGDSSLRQILAALRHPPLYARWMIAIAVFAALAVAIGVAVRNGGSGGSAESEAGALAEANHEAELAIADDQQPRVATLHPGSSVRVALEQAIAADVHVRIHDGQLTGPLQSVHCRAPGRVRSGRRALLCSVRSAGITYPFDGVVDERTSQLIWCKVDPAPTSDASIEVPISARCEVS
jgi:hypothetical protein